MKRLRLVPLAVVVVVLWLAPTVMAASAAAIVIALVCAAVQVGVLLPGYALALRLDRCPGQIGALIGAVAGVVTGGGLHAIAGTASASTLLTAAACGAVSGGLLAAALRACADGHWFPRARADRRPSHWWYWGRALYVSRRDYRRIFFAFLAVGMPLGAAGLLGPRVLFHAALAIAVIGLALLLYSLVGLYRMYGHPSMRYYARLIEQGGVRDGARIADLHIGTYRTAFALADLLPRATIHSIDCWNVDGPPAEEAVADVRALEPAPIGVARIAPARITDGRLPLETASCDVVVFGFGTHEIPTGGPREQLFAEARRVLVPGGIALLFEHGYDVHNYFIFGPVIDHVTRRGEWLATMGRFFSDVTYRRSSAAVDMLAGRRHA